MTTALKALFLVFLLMVLVPLVAGSFVEKKRHCSRREESSE